MARIIISHFSPVSIDGSFQLLVYYDALIRELVAAGNEVYHIISSDFLARPWNGDNEVKQDIDSVLLVERINQISPDLLIVFNNSIPRCIMDSVSCPITIWHGDSFKFFNDKDYLRSNFDRFYFICPFEDTVVYLRQQGVKEDRILQVLPATGVVAEPIEQDKNISFIGTPFISGYGFLSFLKSHGRDPIVHLLRSLQICAEDSCKDLVSDGKFEDIAQKLPFEELVSLESADKRTKVLSLLSDLGLEIYGGREWLDMGLFLPKLALAYNPKMIYSLENNQHVYNTSKIAINISHSQATVGFPWRIMDIMASNACLVTDRNVGVSRFTAEYMEIPSYTSPIEAYDICKKLLQDPVYRLDVVKASNECIRAKGRWPDRFKTLEEGLGVKLICQQNSKGYYSRLLPSDFKMNVGTELNKAKEMKENATAVARFKQKLKRLARLD